MTSKNDETRWIQLYRLLPARASELVQSPVWRRRLLWSVVSVLVLWALAWALVPLIATSQIKKIASEKLGRQVTVGAVDFKPWSLELTITDLAIAKLQPQASNGVPQLKIRRLYINAELVSLLRLAPVADALQIDEPALSLTHLGEGRYDIDDVLARLKQPDDSPTTESSKFALYNIVVSGGKVDFIDQPLRKTHALQGFNLALPFLSNLQSKRNIKTAPRLAFQLNGSSFDTAAEGTPFAQTRKTDATLTFRAFDLKPYVAYFPASLPFKVQAALLNADAKVSFEQTPANVVSVSGTVTADKVQLLSNRAETGPGSELLAFDRLRVVMEDLRPLEQRVKLSTVELIAPVLSITRDRAGQLNLLAALATPGEQSSVAITKIAENDRLTRTPATDGIKMPVKPAANPWRVQVASAALRDGRVNWLDEALLSPAHIRLSGLSLNASTIDLPFSAAAPLKFDGSVGLDNASPVTSAKAGATLAAKPDNRPALMHFSGTATDAAAQVSLTVAAWPLNMSAKYVGQFLLPALGGQLDAQLGVQWQAARADKPQLLNITAPQLSLDQVSLAQGKVSLVSVKRVQANGVDIDVTGKTFKAASLRLVQPKALGDRDADKHWMYERWLAASPASKTLMPPTTTAASKAQAPSWAVVIKEVALEGGAMSFSDKASIKPVAFEVSAVNAKLGALVLNDRLAGEAQSGKPMPFSASLQLAMRRFEPGKVKFNGNFGVAPLQASGQLQVERLPVQAFEPYFADALNIELLRADASFKGRVAYRQSVTGPIAQVTGDASIEEFKANSLAPSEDLLDWKALNLRGLSVALEPAKASRVDVKETVLTDFFARVIVTPEGRINLQDLLKSQASAANATSTAVATTLSDAPKIIAENQGYTGTAALNATKTLFASASAPPAIISFGPMSLVNGKVLFSDRFVKPNYSADLTDLTGRLSAFSSVSDSGTPDMAELELRGRAEGTASLEIFGKLNPLAEPLALDIVGKVRDLELAPLTPYAIKYSGYGINRGKLSLDVNYRVQPNGQLTANNKLVLNQLAFGDKVEGATASLPVKLAVALLADRNGVIDLDLPISGSLNDPQFSLGPIIIKIIINVIGKAITAPFSLLAKAFGGAAGNELGTVGFAPGSARLEAAAKTALDQVAKALEDRPALQLTVVGTSSLEVERDGFKRERLSEMLRAEKRRATVKDGGTASAVVTTSPAEYPALLKEVYKRTDLAKPRNLVGMAKDLPDADMEKLLLASISVNDEAIRGLALQRGVAVKDYLASKSLPVERLFLGAAKSASPDAKWTPRAELNLAVP